MPALLFSFLIAITHFSLLGQLYTAQPEIMPTSESSSKDPSPVSGLSSELLQGDKPKWIWGTDQQKDYTLGRKFQLKQPKQGMLRASCDNQLSIRINGKRIGQSSEWQSPLESNILSYLKEGENTIEADVSNQGGPAGFVLKLVVEQTDGQRISIISDEQWQATIRSQAPVPATVVANYGEGPWGQVLAQGGHQPHQDLFRVPTGFQVERLYQVPRDELGSWVCITMDNRGRLIASDQGNLGLVRITPSPVGSNEPTKIEKLTANISSAQGLLYAFDSLYVCVNGEQSGLYRLRDTNGDDQFDEKTLLTPFRSGGEHGPHAIRLTPDGKSIVLVAGNHTPLPADRTLQTPIQNMGGVRDSQLRATLASNMTTRIAENWDEDVLPTRLWDANGHATGIYAPGGWVAQTDPEGKTWEILSIGYRNQYDFDFNADGEMFVYDSDMEWDMGTSWYRPTRVVHASSGSEFGWRSGTACWPTYYADSLPSLVDIGPGSPVGVTFGYKAKFPAKYQKVLYVCDWTFGTMYAIHMVPHGSTYVATKEDFLSRTPLPLTDALIGNDGSLYFTVGGRGTQSELYRVTYVGKEPTTQVSYHDPQGADLRKLRSTIEAYHRAPSGDEKQLNEAVSFLVPYLSHSDAYVRYAARVALERFKPSLWMPSALSVKKAEGIIEAVMGLAHSGEPDIQEKLLNALEVLDVQRLSDEQKLRLLRAYELVLIRLGKVSEPQRDKLVAIFESMFSHATDFAKRELAVLLVHLDAPNVPSLLVPLLEKVSSVAALSTEELLARNRGYGSSIAAMLSNQPDLQQVHYAFVLREQRSGWNLELRKKYFEWFFKAQKWSGGNSYQKFLVNISNDAFKTASDQDRLALEVLGLRTPVAVPKDLPKPTGPGHDYSVEDAMKLADAGLQGRNFENGKKMFAAARCVVCHRFAGEGGSTGPDLTQAAGRFGIKDMAEAIIEPSKVISDQYKTIILTTEDGDSYSGRVVADLPDSLILVTDPEDSTKTVTVKKIDIAGRKTSTESVMPRGLLKELNEKEVLDLFAYILARGDANHAMFK